MAPDVIDVAADIAADRLAEAERTIASLRKALHRHHVAELALRATAITDEVTGALNWRGLDERATAEVARAERFGSRLSLLLIDLPRTHGDAARAAAYWMELIRRHVRRFDVLASLGKGRVALLLPETDLEGALALRHRLHAVAQADAQLEGDATCSDWKAEAVEVDPYGPRSWRRAMEQGVLALGACSLKFSVLLLS